MTKYQLRLSTRNRNGSWTHQYSKLYNSVAEAFANPAFAAYVQQHHVGEYHTIKVLAVNVADANVQAMLGYASQRVDKRQPFFLLTFNKYAYVLQIYPKSPVNGGRSMQHSCRCYVIDLYEQSTNQSQWSRAIHNGNTIHRCWYCSIYIIL